MCTCMCVCASMCLSADVFLLVRVCVCASTRVQNSESERFVIQIRISGTEKNRRMESGGETKQVLGARLTPSINTLAAASPDSEDPSN